MRTAVNPRGGGARALTCLLVLAAAPLARAQGQEDTDTPAAESEGTVSTPAPADPDAAPPWNTRFGARLVAGAPEGLGVAALIHPRPWLRAHVGATRNTLGFGVRGGLDLIPIQLFITPSLGLEYGHYFKADYNKLLTQLHGEPTTAATGIREVGYDQLSAHLGLELSPSRYVTLFGGVGISYWFIGGNDVKSFIRESENDPDITARPLTLGLSSPVAKLGLILYFN
ncbi:hypothetical protein [Vitiosangium sp. GDMCC 1.1324]|uniref:hypothetical protein n=1 Tax=Vitiosangium sp. (strain GDMCC 1.1324) TaxID=2138576 RepID=UPI000D3B6045|nr:hypothetical protein [Vitiosangium sp. GDMCC 1.1324]PTL84237.1 hypothetical protein DAT35_12460 [Vitiosangium sp. GDMCC 1.1324]